MRGIFAALLTVGVACAAPRPDIAKRYTLDSARTVVTFEVRTFGIFKQRGVFGGSSGRVSLDPEISEGSFDVVIDARSIRASSKARLRIMRGTDFLNVEQFPEIHYQAAHVIFRDGQPVRVEGALTLLGVTRPVPLNISGYRCTPSTEADKERCMMDATGVFKRSEFGMTSSMALAGDRVMLGIHAEASADPSAAISLIPFKIMTSYASKQVELGH